MGESPAPWGSLGVLGPLGGYLVGSGLRPPGGVCRGLWLGSVGRGGGDVEVVEVGGEV